MSGRAAPPPPGYVRRRVGTAELLARADAVDAVARAVESGGTLYDYAAAHPKRHVLQGRAPVYGAPLPNGHRVVVRHSWHGGLLAPLTGDRFFRPTRAPVELAAALRLARAGVPTPEIVCYVRYPGGPLLNRVDVASDEILDAADLGALLADGVRAPDTAAWLPPVAALLAALAAAGARHADLNVKNILLARRAGQVTAFVVDVDRVVFAAPSVAAAANAARLVRSVRKRRAQGLASVGDATLATLAMLGEARGR